MEETRRCIYCLEVKPVAAFDTEHVVQDAFGHFDGALTVDCVCQECNRHFSRTVDLVLARDSLEGQLRYPEMGKPVSEYAHLGRKMKSYAQVDMPGTPMDGAFIHPKPNLETSTFDVEVPGQIAFSLAESGRYLHFKRGTLPTWTELKSRLGLPAEGGPWTVFCRGDGENLETFQAEFLEKGYPQFEVTATDDAAPSGRVRVIHTFLIGRIQHRAATKIALNYVAKVFGAGVALLPQFNALRRFARYDGEFPRDWITHWTWGNPELLTVTRDTGHYVIVGMLAGRLYADVSLLCSVNYRIRLTEAPLLTVAGLGSAHFYALEDMSVYRLDSRQTRGLYQRLSQRTGAALKPMG